MASPAYNISEALADRIADLVVQKLGHQGERKLLDVKAAAHYIGVTAGAVRHMISNGEIPAACVSRYGRRVWLKKAELDQWLEAR